LFVWATVAQAAGLEASPGLRVRTEV